MKKIIFSIVGSMALGAALHAGERILPVTTKTLDGWSVTDADRSALTQSSDLALPGGAQLSRRFGADQIAVQINTQLVFGLAGEDFPTLEVGPAALVFSREGMDGQVVLVMGDTQSNPLPFPVKLNIDGSSIGPVDVQLAYERGTGNVTVTGFGQTLRYVTAASARPVEVVISAGAHDVLTLQNLTVKLVTPDGTTDDAVIGVNDHGAASGSDGKGGGRARPGSTEQSPTGGGGLSTAAALEDKKPPARAGNSLLEVYTPASVRHGRVDAIRAVVAQGRKF